jgi:hypothetical protein
MNKKAVIMSLPADMLGWIIFFAGIIVWVIFFNLLHTNMKYDIGGIGKNIDDQTMMINMLHTPLRDNLAIADGIVLSINGQENYHTQETIDFVLNSIYGRNKKVCWQLYYFQNNIKKNLMSVSCVGDKQILFEQEEILPSFVDSMPVKIKLIVLGYSE